MLFHFSFEGLNNNEYKHVHDNDRVTISPKISLQQNFVITHRRVFSKIDSLPLAETKISHTRNFFQETPINHNVGPSGLINHREAKTRGERPELSIACHPALRTRQYQKFPLHS